MVVDQAPTKADDKKREQSKHTCWTTDIEQLNKLSKAQPKL